MENKKKEENQFSHGQLVKAYNAAIHYYLHRNGDGSLRKQQEVAEEVNLKPPRFSEFLNIAWKAGMIDVIITPPESINKDATAIRELEIKLLQKLQQISPPLLDPSGVMIRPHKLINVHVVPNAAGNIEEPVNISIDETSEYGSVTARICKRAAREFLTVIDDHYQQLCSHGEAKLYCGVGWSRTCERVVNLLPVPVEQYPDLVVCPFTGLIGSRQTSIDANFLAFRLAAKLSADSIKLSCPSIQPIDMNIETLRPIARALDCINLCRIGISGIGVAYDREHPEQTQLLVRQVIDRKQLERVRELGGIAEIHCHYFDMQGNLISFEDLQFKPIGITLGNMKQMSRFMIVVSPDHRKILPTIIAIKAGICSDLVLDHTMAHFMLSDEHDAELGF
ncbi:hypothetical protein GWO43_21735 [candidate division KSB1 bacterium]|nr:hypothetical protein [candidate division KSB1 bacterium]NIX73128.1 hypothetical protein [candidate division KSB1 bacterium]